MPRLWKKENAEWAFFINDIGRRQYNDLCRQCVHECKQSYRAVIVLCQNIRAKERLLDLNTLGERKTCLQVALLMGNLSKVLLRYF